MQTYYDQVYSKTITIDAGLSAVWEVLTNTEMMSTWMFDSGITIITDWKVGSPITIQGRLDANKTGFENKGVVLTFEPERMLRYSHLSSLSGLTDQTENYTVLAFAITSNEGRTALTLTISNFPTEIIYKHLAFYWTVTLESIKKFVALKCVSAV